MPIITIPKKFLRRGGDLVLVPRKEYEELVELKKAIPTFKPTRADLKDLARARRNFKKGNFIEWGQLKHELESSRRSKSKKSS